MLIKKLKEIYDYCVSINKEIIIVSDMYLPNTFIANILYSNMYFNHKKLYVSSDYKKAKWSGKLWDIIKEENKDKSILHFTIQRYCLCVWLV